MDSNTPPAAADASEVRTKECTQVAREIHAIIGEKSNEVPLLKGNDSDGTIARIKWYQALLQDRVLPIIQAANLRTGDIEFLGTLILQPLDFVRESLQDIVGEAVREALTESTARLIIGYLGDEHETSPMGDITKEQHAELKNTVKARLLEKLGSVLGGLIDIQTVMEVTAAPYNMMNNLLAATRSMVVDEAVAHKFGVKSADELRFSHVIETQIERAKGVDKEGSTSASA